MTHGRRSKRLSAPRLCERPKLPSQSVPGEQRHRLKSRGRLPVDIEAGRIPIRAELVEGLRSYSRALVVAARVQPVNQLALRPEGGNVRSGESNVIPEGASRYQEVNKPLADHLAVGHFEPDRLSCSRRVGVERAITEERQ